MNGYFTGSNEIKKLNVKTMSQIKKWINERMNYRKKKNLKIIYAKLVTKAW